jgi:hypothetical protein
MNLVRLAILFGATLVAPALAVAQDFRVETDVFLNDNKEPAAQYLTIFKGGVVYDFGLDGPKEVTIYDVGRGRFILLDPKRSMQVEISLDELRRHTADLKAAAQTTGDANVQFLADPQFQVNLNAEKRSIELASTRLTYAAKGQKPPEEGFVRRYTTFADGYARLNGLRLGNIPPFARMQLNEQLLAQGWVPEEVTRKMAAQAVLAKDVQVRSHHLFTWKVLPTDEKKLNEADRYLRTFKTVGLGEYLDWPQNVAKAQ